MSLWVRNDKSKLHKGEDKMLREAEKYKNVKALYVRFLLETKIDMKQVTDMLSKVSNVTHIELLEDGRLLFVYDFGEAPSEKDYDEFDTFVDELSELFGYGERYSFDYASRKYKKDVPTFFGHSSPEGLMKRRFSAEFMDGYYNCTLSDEEWKNADSYMDYLLKIDNTGIALRDIEKQEIKRGMYMRFRLLLPKRKDAEKIAGFLKSIDNIHYTEDIYEHLVLFILYIEDPLFNNNEINNKDTIRVKRNYYIKECLREFHKKLDAIMKNLSISEYVLEGVDSNKGSYGLNVYFNYFPNKPDTEILIIASDEEINALPCGNSDKRRYRVISKSILNL
jgi:hypothetical protein